MSMAAARVALILTVAAGVSLASADPAVTARSAWSLSAPKADVSLKDPLVRRGKEVFDARCRACHGSYPQAPANNALPTPPASRRSLPGLAMQVPGTFALQLRYKGQKTALLEERTDLTPEAVAAFVRHGGGGFMPAFRPTEVSDEDLKALGAYLARKR
jgi:mono/diheme cytochrome c family protein